jgi:AcrR family transcriptional regulator
MAQRSADPPKRRAAEIIDAAAEVFDQRGYHGATTQDIANVLGIRQASLYYYFPSKEEALAQICERGVEGHIERALAIARGPEPARDKIAALIGSHLAPMRDRAAYVRVFLKERHHLPDATRRRVGRLARRYERIVQDVLEAGVASGELGKDLDCRMTALAMIGMCNAATAWYGIEQDADHDRIVAAFARLALDGTLAPRTRSARAHR